MASYLSPQIDHNLYTPILPQTSIMEIATMISQKQQLYNAGVRTASNKINQMSDLENSVTSEYVKGQVKDYNEKVNSKLDEYKSLDFSIQDNVNLIDNLYTPLLDDKTFNADLKTSLTFNSEIKKAYSLATSEKQEERDAFSNTNLKFVTNGVEALSKASSKEEVQSAINNYGNRRYRPYVDYRKRMQEIIKDSGFEVVEDNFQNVNGHRYKVRNKNGELVADSLETFVRANLGQDEIEQMQIEATVLLEDQASIFGKIPASLEILNLAETNNNNTLSLIESNLATIESKLLTLDKNNVEHQGLINELTNTLVGLKTSQKALLSTKENFLKIKNLDPTDPINEGRIFEFAKSEATSLIYDNFTKSIASSNASLKRESTLTEDPYYAEELKNKLSSELEVLKTSLDSQPTTPMVDGQPVPTVLDYAETSSVYVYKDLLERKTELKNNLASNLYSGIESFYETVNLALPTKDGNVNRGLYNFLEEYDRLDESVKSKSIKDLAKEGNVDAKYLYENKLELNKQLSKYNIGIKDELTLKDFRDRLVHQFNFFVQNYKDQDGIGSEDIYSKDVVKSFENYNRTLINLEQEEANIKGIEKIIKDNLTPEDFKDAKISVGGKYELLSINYNLKDYITKDYLLDFSSLDKKFPIASDKFKEHFKKLMTDRYNEIFNAKVQNKLGNSYLINTSVLSFKNDMGTNDRSASLFYHQNLRNLPFKLAESLAMEENAGAIPNATRVVVPQGALTSDQQKILNSLMQQSDITEAVSEILVHGGDKVSLKYNIGSSINAGDKDDPSKTRDINPLNSVLMLHKGEPDYEDYVKVVEYMTSNYIVVKNAGLDQNKFGLDTDIITLANSDANLKIPLAANTKNFNVTMQRKAGDKSAAPYKITYSALKPELGINNSLVINDDGSLTFSPKTDYRSVSSLDFTSAKGSTSNYDFANSHLENDKLLYKFANTEKGRALLLELKTRYNGQVTPDIFLTEYLSKYN